MTIVRRALGPLFLAALSSLALAASAAAATSTPNERGLLDAESERFHAQIERDLPSLDRAIADEAVYIHASGLEQTKGQYLHDVEAGVSKYANVEAVDRDAKIIGQVGITHGLVTLTFGDGNSLAAHYTGLYVKRDGRWQVLSWQSTPAPKPK